jgi:lysophospholipase L1-like esterase
MLLGSDADGVVNLDVVSPFNSPSTCCTNPTYYKVDQIHLTPAGYAVVAAAVAPVILGL